MPDTTSIRCVTFGDMVSIGLNRGQIAGTAQDRDLNFFKGALNEHNMRISTERDWAWRKMDRDIVFKRAVTTGTVAVVQDSREVVFTGLTVDEAYPGKSIKITGDNVLYRVIGVDISANSVFLAAPFAGTTDADATFKLYTYEFPLPPDCDDITQIYYDYPSSGRYGGEAQLDPVSVVEFNRLLASNPDYIAAPMQFTRDGKISAETMPPLDSMVLDYDFLGGDAYTQVDKLRVFPIEPDVTRVLHLNYSVHVEDMANDSDVPLMPVDDRWVLVHFALADWFRVRGQDKAAIMEMSIANGILKEMRNEHKRNDLTPKFKVSYSRHKRSHGRFNDKKEIMRISRLSDV